MSDTSTAERVTAGLLVIGDEILSGRTKDVNIGTTAEFCTDLGIELSEVRIVPDDIAEIVGAVDALRARYTYVFTTGGIGPTHDDITADAIAKAFGVALPINEEAKAVMMTRWKGVGVTPARLRMARIPEGAELVVNSVSAAPGFWIENVIVMAGVPVVMKAMLEAVAPKLRGGRKILSAAVDAPVGEGAIGDPLAALQAEFPDVKMGSYPRMGQDRPTTQIVLRSVDEDRLGEARARVEEMVASVAAERGVSVRKEDET